MAEMFQDLTQVNQKALDTALELARVSIENAERVMHMQLETAKRFVAQQSAAAKMLAGAKTPQEMETVRTRLVEQAVESLLGYSREMSDAAVHTQRDLAKMVEQRFAAYQQEMGSAMTNMMQSAPAGTDPAATALRSTMTAAAAAMENMTKAAKQAAELAETNVKAMSEVAANALRSGGRNKG